MGDMQSFHIPPPNDELKRFSRLIRMLCMDFDSDEEIIRNISCLSSGIQDDIDLIGNVLKSDEPDKLLGAPLYMVVEDASNFFMDSEDEYREFLHFILEELQKRQKEIQGR